MSKTKTTTADEAELAPTPTTEDVVVATTIPAAPATEGDVASPDVTDEPKSEAEELFDQVMAESGDQLQAEVLADIEQNGLQLTDEEKAEIKKTADAALTEAARIRELSADEFEAEFGFKFIDGISIAEQTIQKSEHVHKDRIFSLLQKIKELYVG